MLRASPRRRMSRREKAAPVAKAAPAPKTTGATQSAGATAKAGAATKKAAPAKTAPAHARASRRKTEAEAEMVTAETAGRVLRSRRASQRDAAEEDADDDDLVSGLAYWTILLCVGVHLSSSLSLDDDHHPTRLRSVGLATPHPRRGNAKPPGTEVLDGIDRRHQVMSPQEKCKAANDSHLIRSMGPPRLSERGSSFKHAMNLILPLLVVVVAMLPSPTSACAVTCYGASCDYWVANSGDTCSLLEDNYGCDCSGCAECSDDDGGGAADDGCTDIDNGALDPSSDSCDDYTEIPNWCGAYDDSDFSSEEMCCACGGGWESTCVSTNNGAQDSEGYRCGVYVSDPTRCGAYDDGDFSSDLMCCVCGGGAEPSAAPTPAPTSAPTPTPTPEPTSMTASPSVSAPPTGIPTPTPTATPTAVHFEVGSFADLTAAALSIDQPRRDSSGSRRCLYGRHRVVWLDRDLDIQHCERETRRRGDDILFPPIRWRKSDNDWPPARRWIHCLSRWRSVGESRQPPERNRLWVHRK